MISFDLCNKINLKFSIYTVFHQNLAIVLHHKFWMGGPMKFMNREMVVISFLGKSQDAQVANI